ncbi:MAG: FliM/FliN family flagellar motor switch protein [Alphaproteobacteria bacterium]
MNNSRKNNISDEEISIDISVTLGTADLRVQQLLKLGRGAVVELDRDVNDYVDIYANDVLIGHGEVVITENESIGVSITDTVKKSRR